MPNHKSAWKRMRQNKVRHERNVRHKSAMKTSQKKVLAAIKEGNEEEAKKSLIEAIKMIDKACSKGVIHKKSRSRKVSRLTIKVNSMNTATS